MNIGAVVKGIFVFLFEDAFSVLVTPFLALITNIALSPAMLAKMEFIDAFSAISQTVGLALLILISSWQMLKSMLVGIGLEVEEPHKVVFRTFIASILMFQIRNLMMYFIEVTHTIVEQITRVSIGESQAGFLEIVGNVLKLDVIYIVMFIYVVVKVIGLSIRMWTRLVMGGVMLVVGPIVVSTMVSKATEGFFQGFVKLFAGNLIIQVIQSICFVSFMGTMGMVSSAGFGITSPSEGAYFYLMLTASLISICGKLEDIVRDVSVSVGIGRDMQGAMGRVQSVAYSAMTISQISKTFVK